MTISERIQSLTVDDIKRFLLANPNKKFATYSAGQCPIATMLHSEYPTINVEISYFRITDNEVTVFGETPQELSKWVKWFDQNFATKWDMHAQVTGQQILDKMEKSKRWKQ